MTTQPWGVRRGRPAFTLIELLVVIAIIAVLAGLSSVAVMRWIDTGKQQTTVKTIDKVKLVLDRQVKDVLKQADEETIPAAVVALAGSDMPRARVIWKKLRLRQEFPMTLAEATQAPAGLNIPELQPLYAKVPNIANLKAGSASAALLLLSLKKSRGGSRLTEDDLGNHALDTDGDGFKEIIDGWGNPVTFCRWPTNNAGVDGSDPAAANTRGAKSRDPMDPDGSLLAANWYNTPQRTQFESLCHKIKPATAVGGGANGAYFFPVIVSSGRDNKLGLDTTTLAVTTAADAGDNIYSFTLRQ